jgi:predicted nucleic acid-binding protein
VGLTLIDAGVLIGFLDAADTHHTAARQSLLDADARRDRVAIPASAFAEALVSPARRGESAIAAVQAFIAEAAIDVAPLDTEVAMIVARLRARHGPRLRLPDALVIATAQILAADVLVTTDHGWPPQATLEFPGQIVAI